jgi:hypothetical protein
MSMFFGISTGKLRELKIPIINSHVFLFFRQVQAYRGWNLPYIFRICIIVTWHIIGSLGEIQIVGGSSKLLIDCGRIRIIKKTA